MPSALSVANLGAPPADDADAWEAAKSSPFVDTLVEAAVVAVIAALANAALHMLCALAAPVAAVR